MRISLICSAAISAMHGKFDVENLFGTRALTGSESCFFNVARGLSELGHQIIVSCDVVKPLPRCEDLSGAQVQHIDEPLPPDMDAYISLSDPTQFQRMSNGRRGVRILQLQYNDLKFCQPGYEKFTDIVACLSPVHREHFLETGSTIKEDKVCWIPNSINLDLFDQHKSATKTPHSMAWCSSPDRGLHRLLEIFPLIRNKIPDATLEIFYNFDYWYRLVKDADTKDGARARYIEKSLEILGRNGENGVNLVGPVPNKQIAIAFAETDVLPYTCDCTTFTEGFSVTIMDACATGAIPVISDADAIGDIYRNVAYQISGKPGEKKDEWVAAVVRAMTDEPFRAAMRKRARIFAEQFSRQRVAKVWERLIARNVGEKHDFDFTFLQTSIQSYAFEGMTKEQQQLFTDNDPLRSPAPPPTPPKPATVSSVTTPKDDRLRVAVILGFAGAATHGIMDAENIFTTKKNLVTGSVSGFFNIAGALAGRGHLVDGFCQCTEPVINSKQFEGANFYVLGTQKVDVTKYNTFIVINEPDLLRQIPPTKTRICAMWVNDFSFCQPDFDNFIDVYACPSETLCRHLVSTSKVPPSKFEVVPLSINLEFFRERKKRRPGSIAYCSSPDRGLHHLLDFFPAIRARVPDANLKIYYTVASWYESVLSNPAFRGSPMWDRANIIYNQLNKLGRNGENGVTLVGPVPNQQVVSDLLETKVLAYPCDPLTFTEGFSVTTLEACAAGCIPLISDADALPEIYGGGATILPRPTSAPAVQEWIDTIVTMLTDAEAGSEARVLAKAHAPSFSRPRVAKQWEDLIRRRAK